jgi:signal transduction histidine kinase
MANPEPPDPGLSRRNRLRTWLALFPLFPLPQLLTRRLYLRIWLAVVAAVVLLALLAGWLWRLDIERERAERPGREIVLLNAQGVVVGQAPARPVRAPGHGPLEFQVTMQDGQTLYVQLPRPKRAPDMHVFEWGLSPQALGFLGMLALVSVAVALGTYPVVRWLTQRLEALQKGVERWGEGDLSARLPVQGHDEVAYLAERFNVAAQRVQALVQSHKALLANASHELRSPLARIRMGLELLDAGDPVRMARQREEIARNISELDQLIDEILLASRMDSVESVQLQKEEIDLVGLAAEECARTGAQLDIDNSVVLQADARLLRRLLRNLLENARRHGQGNPDGMGISKPNTGDAHPDAEPSDADTADVSLSLSSLVIAGQPHARIQVDDRGPGVPVDQRERIFEPFYRLAGASERDGGVGLGLALVRTIAQKHGGRVRCEARPGGGARFVVELPLTSG